MSPREIVLVQASWRQVQPIAAQAAALFYTRLFTLEPSVRALFKGDMEEQGRKLMTMITFAVNSLSRVEAIVPGLQALGRRHAGYGVKERHYAVVEEALIWTLEQGLGAKFTPEMQSAWRVAYGVLATTMKEASAEANA